MAEQSNVALAYVAVGGRRYPLVSERTCRTCQSPYRREAEELAVSGVTWGAIAARLPADAGLSARNLGDHFRNGHLPMAAEATQRLAERNAVENGAIVSAGADALCDYLAFAQAVVGRVRDRLEAGEVEPTVPDALKAAAILASAEQTGAAPVDHESYQRAFVVYCRLALETMGGQMFSEFARRLQADPDLARLIELTS